MSDMHSDFKVHNFTMHTKMCPLCCEKHSMAEYSGVWFCSRKPMSQGGFSQKNLERLSHNVEWFQQRIREEQSAKEKALKNLEEIKEKFDELEYDTQNEIETVRDNCEEEVRNANARAARAADNSEQEAAFMHGFGRMMRRISNDIAFLTVKD